MNEEKIERAINIIKLGAKMSEQYYQKPLIITYSGGKDSDVLAHLSVSPLKKNVTPTWDEMCWIKNMFFYDDEVVVQYHPAKSEYVNNMPNCLHLWRCTDREMPTPSSIMVGVKNGQTVEDLKEAIRELYSKGEH